MLLILKLRLVLIILLACFVPAASFGAVSVVFNGQINAEGINIRADATAGSAVICSLAKGTLVEVVSEVYDWYKIRLPKEAPSYVREDLLECINSDSLTDPAKCLSGKVIRNRINIRLGPSESAWILGKADKLTVVNILSQKNGWYKIQPIYRSYGWVNKKFVTREIAPTKKQEVVLLPSKDISVERIPLSDGLFLRRTECFPDIKTITGKPNFRKESLKVVGVVFPYGMVLWRKATHKLITSENRIYLLKGNRKGLDNLNQHRVKITGELISPAQDKYPIIQVNIVEALN